VADENAETPQETLPARTVAAAAAFVAKHGKPTLAVVENIGRAGARVVLVGADGALGDVMVPTEAAGAELAEKVDGLEASEWDRETVAATKIGPAHRRKMANRFGG